MSKKHGESKPPTKEYSVWTEIKRRCFNSKCKAYKYYGGRGITMCKEWQYDYTAFLLHIKRAPTKEHTIDRIDTNRHYEPGNIQWATVTEQNNNKRNNILICKDGITKTMAQWSRELKINDSTIGKRILKYAYTFQEAISPLSDPVIRNRKRKNNHYLTVDGETKLLIVWAEERQIPYTVLRGRIRLGWSAKDVVYRPYTSLKCHKDKHLI